MSRAPSPPTAVDEIAAALSGEVARCAARAAEQAWLLESVGQQSVELTCEIFRDAGAEDLRHRACSLRGLVLHALAVVAELQCVAGRLDALAALRAAERAPDDEGQQ